MLKLHTYTLAAIAAIFSMAAYGADTATDKSVSPPAPVSISEELARNPAQFLRAAATADSLGYVYAVVSNPTNVTVANVYVKVVHFDAATRQPDNQSDPILVAAILPSKKSSRLMLEGERVYKQAELELYRVIIVGAELAK